MALLVPLRNRLRAVRSLQIQVTVGIFDINTPVNLDHVEGSLTVTRLFDQVCGSSIVLWMMLSRCSGGVSNTRRTGTRLNPIPHATAERSR